LVDIRLGSEHLTVMIHVDVRNSGTELEPRERRPAIGQTEANSRDRLQQAGPRSANVQSPWSKITLSGYSLPTGELLARGQASRSALIATTR
jgi:hypothetical protein